MTQSTPQSRQQCFAYGEAGRIRQCSESYGGVYVPVLTSLLIDNIQKCCPQTGSATWFEYCDFSQYITFDSAGNAHPKTSSGECGALIAQMGQTDIWNSL
ncbi:hypothetical protein ANCCEY_03520 [Ancylostoma ceylanicum]|uniref:Uncharacterized protein n=1 Tax=Ancylostoma ceylanicum TaxID=53326 RepID=A0A0D6MB31_9BILA|nr:hypothetical protein ANCCEY_03520 [Ancylostoma ceylanicum]